MLRLIPLFVVIACPAYAQDPSWPPEFNTLIEETASYCDGEFSLVPDAIQQVDLNGDGMLDWIMNSGGFRCSNAATLYCGLQGCGVDTLINGARGMLTLRAWDLLTEEGVTYLIAPNDNGETVRFLWTGAEWQLQ